MFKWEAIRDLYMRACGDTPAAANEFFDHATAASRWLASIAQEKELVSTAATVTLASGDESFDWDQDAYSIMTVFNQTTQNKVEPEPAGMRGRSRYLRSDGKPSSGTVSWYHAEGKKVWVRDKANAETTLQINFKMVPPNVTAALLSKHPIFPPHMDYALVFKTTAFYYHIHPVQAEEGRVPKGEQFDAKALNVVLEARPPKQEHNLDRRESFKQWGYQMW
jgi:hypothetical protein